MLSLASLNPKNFTPVQAPNPVVRQKTLADARAMQQNEQLRGQQLQQGEQELQAQQAAMEKAKAVTDVLVRNQGDFAKALPELKTIDPQFALGVEKELQSIATSKATIDRGKRDDEIRLVELEGKSMDRLAQIGKDAIAANKPIEVSPGASLFDQIQGRFTATAPSAPRAPENLASDEKAIDDLMTREGLNYADAYRKIHPISQGTSGEPLVPVDDGSGNVTYVPRSQAAGAKVPSSSANKPPTGVERRVLNFYIRAKDGKATLDKIESDIEKLGVFEQGKLKLSPNIMQSELGQAYVQAQRAFIEAYLRKDSGAAIPPNEYVEAAKTYFMDTGDTKQTLANKKRGREAIMEGLKMESGRAYKEHYGDTDAGLGGNLDATLDRIFGPAPVKK